MWQEGKEQEYAIINRYIHIEPEGNWETSHNPEPGNDDNAAHL